MKVQKLRTKIQLDCTKEEATRKSPSYESPKILVVRHGGQVIFTERNPLTESIELAQKVRQYSPLKFSYMVERPTERRDGYMRVGHEDYYVSEIRGDTHIGVESFHTDMNNHYENVERVKEELARLGIRVLDGECEITIMKKC